MEIEIRREWVWALVVIPLALTLGGIGYVVSPRSTDGRPVLLLPDVRAVETYRRQAAGWTRAWVTLDERIQAARADSNLLSQSREAQGSFERAVALAQSVDETDAPPALLGLRDQTAATAAAYVDATAALNRWLSAPSDENWAALEAAYQQAAAALGILQTNDWVRGDLQRSSR